MGNNRQLFNRWVLGVLVLLNAACAKQLEKPLKNTTTRASLIEVSYDERVCPENQTVLGTTGAKLSEFFGTIINADFIEGPVTYCLHVDRLSSSASTNVETGFAIELEHGSSNVNDKNDGILFLEFGYEATNRIKSVVYLNSTTNKLTIDLIYRDNYGLVGVKGEGDYNSAIRADIRFYNFPSYEEAVTEAARKAKEECLAAIDRGDGTAAQKCWGLTPAIDRAWWLQPTQTSNALVDAAEEALQSERSRKLGSIDINIEDVQN